MYIHTHAIINCPKQCTAHLHPCSHMQPTAYVHFYMTHATPHPCTGFVLTTLAHIRLHPCLCSGSHAFWPLSVPLSHTPAIRPHPCPMPTLAAVHACPCNTSACFGPYQHFTIPVCPGYPHHAICSHGTPVTNSGPYVVPHVTSRPCDNTPANALQAHQSPICPCLNCALIMPLCCPHVLAPLCQFPSMCLAIFHHIYSSRLCLGCAMHLAVPFHSGHAPPASHAYPGTFKFKPLPLSAPLPALIQSLCSFNRILTCPPSNLHGICEVGCYQFFHQSLLGLG